MKKETILKINNLVINYMSIIGISGSKEDLISDDNPLLSYFYKYIFTSNKPKDDDIKISRILFYNMIKESYRIYKKLDSIITNQHTTTRNLLINIVGKEDVYDTMIEQILKQYRESLYQVVSSYNGKDKDFLDIKISLLTERMIIYGHEEDFDNAILLQNRIKEFKKILQEKEEKEKDDI